MSWWSDLVKSPARRKAEQDKVRRKALTEARTALRRERRAIAKKQQQSDVFRQEAVQHEREGKASLSKQKVRRMVQTDKEAMARSLALDNMEHALDQAKTKDNYEDFMRSMQVVANIEELAHSSVDPDEIRERLADLAHRNQDLIEPWMEAGDMPAASVSTQIELNSEESEAYGQVINDAAGAIRSGSPGNADSEFATMDAELEKKMDEALGKE
jgi:hypothetical protein